MSLNLDAIKNKLNQLNKIDNKKSNLWRPEPGTTKIRIVPYVHNKENPFIELYFNYEIAKKSLVSPISFGNADPIAEFAEKLQKTGDKDEWVLGRKIAPKMRTYVPIIVRGKEEEGVKFWGFGKTIYTELLSIITDPDYGDITDLMKGRDITVEFTPPENDQSYPKTQVRVKPNITPATEDKDIAKKIMDQPKITDVYPEPTYQELEELLQKWLNVDEDADSTTDTSSTSTESSNSWEESTETKNTSDVSQAFDQLFNENE